MANRVLPVSTSDAVDEENDSSIARKRSAFLAAKRNMADRWSKLASMFTYENARNFAVWFLDTANIKFSLSFDDLMMIMTFFVLFADDIRLLTAPKSVDVGFQTANSICLFFFIFELLLTTWAKTHLKFSPKIHLEGYCFSFFFWLDLIAILSMLPDINWIAEGMGIAGISESVSSTNDNFSKAGRVVRTVRLARLVRLYKIQAERNRLKRVEEEQMELVRQGLMSYEEVEKMRKLNQERNSKVGAELSDTTTRRVIIIVLLMLCLVPILTFSESDHMQHFSARTLHYYNVYGDNTTRTAALDEFMDTFESLNGDPYVIRLEMQPFIDGFVVNEQSYVNNIRSTALSKESFKSSNSGTTYKTVVWYNNQGVVEEVALNGIMLTIFVSLVMLTGTIVFNADVERLVLTPIQRMMNMVEQVSKDPLSPLFFDHTEGSGEYETRLLEGTIEKITGLLRVGFGEAGAGIISANLNLEDNSSVINPLIPGVRVYAIFGFCDIHHFEDVNEKLGKDVMTFVNTIAAVVHNYVHDWRGQSNKNLGQAFLVVWRIGDEQTLSELLSQHRDTKIGKSSNAAGKRKGAQIDLRRIPGVDTLADMALIAYCKIIAEINRSKEILAYRSEERLTMNGTQEFKVRMGFGLHAGWAIEGAVGSLQKVDATYLSPHVNMAARLESSSKQYGVPILVSQNFFDLMTEDAKAKCRRLDVITVKGSEVPIGIYTYDCRQDQHFRSKRSARNTKDGPPVVFLTSSNETSDVFEKDYDMLTLREHITPEFLSTFQQGLEYYLQGDWGSARGFLERATQMMSQVPSMEKGDGPSLTLLRYMENHGWQAPSSWKGFRPLTSK
mmetsp:Transcript_24385/g.35798  ORF Transcript_24385/g.35798 Transcript_24385/m.35798 type:complete len:840 (+) Transcript_24385:136-2655(+)|eukprot:CAMPEP_0185029906 /NCGR_PEP_ID=MMETSP1103-20130426/16541_1 /TAXON_ID=36769 /ORGANISM="Paraphysomonas bandaiensis, Strain Caron Lab Isolate" /LENGTH=839 /DNA_ID=CAMNT_0027564831 /DNA_START=59 /DNA_END=2578 /DNA_ORIENTATION=+